MPVPGGVNVSLGDVWGNLTSYWRRIRNRAVSLRATSLAGPVAFMDIYRFQEELRQVRVAMQALAATPGIVAYAQNQLNSPGLDISTEYMAMLAQVDLTITTIWNGLPRDANGYFLQLHRDDENGAASDRTFPTNDPIAVGLRTRLDALIATISG